LMESWWVLNCDGYCYVLSFVNFVLGCLNSGCDTVYGIVMLYFGDLISGLFVIPKLMSNLFSCCCDGWN